MKALFTKKKITKIVKLQTWSNSYQIILLGKSNKALAKHEDTEKQYFFY